MLNSKMLQKANMTLVRGFDETDPYHIDLKCNVCGNIKKLSVQQVSVATSVQCQCCEGKKILERNLMNLYGRIPYDFLTSYKNNKEPMKVRCKDCGSEFVMIPAQMVATKNYPNGVHPCKFCTRNRTASEQLKEFNLEEEYHYGEIKHEPVNVNDLISLQMSEKIKFRCLSCKEEFMAVPLLLATNKTPYCPKCCPDVDPNVNYHRTEILSVKNDEKIKGKKVLKVKSTLDATVRTMEGRKLKSSMKEFKSFLYKIYKGGLVMEDDEVTVPGQKLQFYIPELKYALVFCEFDKYNELVVGKNVIQERYLACKEKGINVIHIFEDEWVSKRQIVQDKIKHILHLNKNEKIFARNCEIKDVENDIKNQFLEKYHIQGKDSSSIKLGLYEKKTGELVSILTLGPKRVCMGVKHTHEGEYELIRFASRTDKIVVGGFSKLLKHFIKEFNPKLITTFADCRYTSFSDERCNLYNKNGFTFDHMTEPNYWYYKKGDTSKRTHRFSYRKQNLQSKLSKFDPNLTEKANCIADGVLPIYDAGNLYLTIDLRTEEEKEQWAKEDKEVKEKRLAEKKTKK